MKQKRFLVGILALCMILSLLPFGAAAEETVEQQLIDSCTYGKTVDISRHKLTETQLETLFYGTLYEGKLPWYTESSYTYYYNDQTGYMLEFEPDLLDREKYDRMRYAQRFAEVLDACVLEGMEQWQIALAIHDYLIVNSIYDETLELNTGYDLLVNGSTVCSGYAALYQELLLRCGIPCLQVESDPMDHVWNLVQLDGQWYHVDVTWDDPTPDTRGMVSHEYFLRTDAEMSAGEDSHYDWETDITCTDTRYSGAFWEDVYSRILFTDADTCFYIRDDECRNSIYRREIASQKETRIYREKAIYINIGKGEYMYFHTGLSLWNDRLWFCTMNGVYSMTLDGKDIRKEYTYKTGTNGRFLAGCHVENDQIWLTAEDHDGNAETVSYTLAASGAHIHSYTQTVTAPTCLEPGYTTAFCDCGITAKGDPVAAAGHALQETAHAAATFFSGGYRESVCVTCGETDWQALPQIDFGKWLSENSRTVIVTAAALIGGIGSIIKKRKRA